MEPLGSPECPLIGVYQALPFKVPADFYSALFRAPGVDEELMQVMARVSLGPVQLRISGIWSLIWSYSKCMAQSIRVL